MGVFESSAVSYVNPKFRPLLSPNELPVFEDAMSLKTGDLNSDDSAARHSLRIFTNEFLAADTFALFLTPINAGIATADNIANTAITTTSSTRENPLLKFFLFNPLKNLGNSNRTY